MRTVLWLTIIAACALLFPVPASAGTVAYWRYEDDTYSDSYGDNGLSAVGDPVIGDDAGHGLWDPIPNPDPTVGASSNTAYCTFDGDDATWADAIDQWTPTTEGFTIEAMVRPSGFSGESALASVWSDGLSSRRSWQFGIDSAQHPYLKLWDGSETVVTSDLTVSSGEVTALAATWAPGGDVELYSSTGGAVWSKYSEATGKDIADISEVFAMGSETDIASDFYTGDMDEVRFSTGVLGEGDFLATPEPAATCLALAAAAAGVFAVWRRKRRGDESPDEAA